MLSDDKSSEAQAPAEQDFPAKLLSNAAFLMANYGNLTEAEARVIAMKLEDCAERIKLWHEAHQRWEGQRQELYTTIDSLRSAELRRCQDGQPCKKPGECEARGKCHVFKGTPMEGLTITTNDLLNEARCKFAMPSNTTYPSRGAANEVRRFILSLASAYERALILLDATQKNYVRSHVERIPNIDHLTVQELQALQGKVLLLLQHRVLGDPSQGVVFPPERTAP